MAIKLSMPDESPKGRKRMANAKGFKTEDKNPNLSPNQSQRYTKSDTAYIAITKNAQFAGMGAGGLSSSGFRNAQIQGSTDLSERLGALRAGLRQSGAAGLAGLGGMGLNPYSQNIQTQEGSPGFLSSFAPAIGSGISSAIGNWFSPSTNTTPNPTPSPTPSPLAPASFSTQNRIGKNTSPYQGSSGNMMSPYGSMGSGIPASPMMMGRF